MADVEFTEGDEFQQEVEDEVQQGEQPVDEGAVAGEAEPVDGTVHEGMIEEATADPGEASEAVHEGVSGEAAEVVNGSGGEAAAEEAVVPGSKMNSRDDDQRFGFGTCFLN